jgi:hypothetical protein
MRKHATPIRLHFLDIYDTPPCSCLITSPKLFCYPSPFFLFAITLVFGTENTYLEGITAKEVRVFHPAKFQRRYCSCGKPAIYYSHSRHRHVRRIDHPLCQRCWRAQNQRLLAQAR